VGIGTVLADDPLLTPRPALKDRMPLRIVVDSRLRIPRDCQLVRTTRQAPLLVATTQRAMQTNPNIVADLINSGTELLAVCPGPGPVNLDALLDELGRRQVSNLMIEGGSAILTQFIQQGLADEIYAFIAPKLIGGATSPCPFAGAGIANISQALQLQNVTFRKFGTDLMLHGEPPGPKDYLDE